MVGISNLCNAEEEWVGHCPKVHEVRDGNDVWVGSRLVGAPVWGIRSPSPKEVCWLEDVDWLG